MQRRTYLTAAASTALVGFAGCAANSSSDKAGDDPARNGTRTGMLATAVSDNPQTAIDDFESLIVTIEEIWLHPKNTDTTDHENGSDGSATHGQLSVTTDTNGTATFNVPTDIDKIGVDVTASEKEGEIEYEFTGDSVETENDAPLDVTFVGAVSRGAETTIKVSENGVPVSEATAEVTFERDAKTESNGDESDKSDSKIETTEGKISIKVDSQQVDLVTLQGDAKSVISETELQVREFTGLKLHVSDVEGTLTDGSKADVTTPGEAPLKFNKEFEIRERTKTAFTADFAPHRRGPNGYILRPVASDIHVEYTALEQAATNETTTNSNASDTNATTTNTSN